MLSRSTCAFLPLAFVLLIAGACSNTGKADESKPKPALRAEISDEITLSAQVLAMEPARRGLTLRREDGELIELTVREDVTGYDRVGVGDTLRVRYQAKLSVLRMPKGTEAAPVEATLAAARAGEDVPPAAGVGLSVRLRVRIESIDQQRAIVVFSLSSGELIAHRLRTDEGRAFVKQLALGDVVEIERGETLVLGIDKL